MKRERKLIRKNVARKSRSNFDETSFETSRIVVGILPRLLPNISLKSHSDYSQSAMEYTADLRFSRDRKSFAGTQPSAATSNAASRLNEPL